MPERIYLQSEIQDYTSLVETLEEILADWNDAGADADEAGGPVGRGRPDGGRRGARGEGRRAPGVWWDKIMSLFR